MMLENTPTPDWFNQTTVHPLGLETISECLLRPILLVADIHKECQDGETQWQDADNLESG